MPSSSPLLANIWNLCLILLVALYCAVPALSQAAKEPVTPGTPPPQHLTSLKSNDPGGDLLCTPFGTCEPCPAEALHEPYCRPFGNRRLMHCINATDPHSDPSHKPAPPSHADSPLHPAGEILAWESCGRIVAKERADFYEFVAVNVVFAIIALGVVFFRSRRMQLMQARQLAARIGLFREEPGRGRGGRI